MYWNQWLSHLPACLSPQSDAAVCGEGSLPGSVGDAFDQNQLLRKVGYKEVVLKLLVVKSQLGFFNLS